VGLVVVGSSELAPHLPSCVFKLPPHLLVLNANGNNLLGAVPTTISPSIKNISLSRNKLFGTISAQLATSASPTSLDLSYNHISGNLDAFANSSGDQFFIKKEISLKLQINHLSGDIPDSLQHLSTISILSGNVFACSASRNELPEHNPT
jgi:hypothetical protein